MAALSKCVAEPSGNPPGPPHACRTRTLRMPAKTSLVLRVLVYFVHTAGVLRTRNVSEYMLVLALCLVLSMLAYSRLGRTCYETYFGG